MRFEGDNEAALQRIQKAFAAEIRKIKSDAQLPF